jgi:hypothetical protein
MGQFPLKQGVGDEDNIAAVDTGQSKEPDGW